MVAAIIALAAAAAPTAVPMLGRPAVALAGADIRIGDVADLSALDPAVRERLAGRVIARLPRGRSRILLSGAALAALVRRSAPELGPVVAPGETLFTGAPAAAVPAAAPRAPVAPAVEAGAKLMLVSTAGPVRIEREVTALQPAGAGGRLFVRDGDGAVIAAPLAEAQR